MPPFKYDKLFPHPSPNLGASQKWYSINQNNLLIFITCSFTILYVENNIYQA